MVTFLGQRMVIKNVKTRATIHRVGKGEGMSWTTKWSGSNGAKHYFDGFGERLEYSNRQKLDQAKRSCRMHWDGSKLFRKNRVIHFTVFPLQVGLETEYQPSSFSSDLCSPWICMVTFILEFGFVTLPSIIVDANTTFKATNTCYVTPEVQQQNFPRAIAVGYQVADVISGKVRGSM